MEAVMTQYITDLAHFQQYSELSSGSCYPLPVENLKVYYPYVVAKFLKL